MAALVAIAIIVRALFRHHKMATTGTVQCLETNAEVMMAWTEEGSETQQYKGAHSMFNHSRRHNVPTITVVLVALAKEQLLSRPVSVAALAGTMERNVPSRLVQKVAVPLRNRLTVDSIIMAAAVVRLATALHVRVCNQTQPSNVLHKTTVLSEDTDKK